MQKEETNASPRPYQSLWLSASVCFGLVCWAGVLYKAIHLPLTHDEFSTIAHYSQFSVGKIMLYPDPWPNNHILNTLLAKLSIGIFGPELWAARLPSVLAFGIYIASALSMGRLLFPKSAFLAAATLVFFIFNPYLLDFFSLGRGYALSVAFLLASSFFLWRAYIRGRERELWMALGLAMLSAYANFTALIFWCAVNGLILLFWIGKGESPNNKKSWRKWVLWVLVNTGYLALIYTPIQKMQSSDQFRFWEANSFYTDTVMTLIHNSRYGSSILSLPDSSYGWTFILLIILSAGYLARQIYRDGFSSLYSQTGWLGWGLLSLTVGVNRLQAYILSTPNLTDRTALLFFPLFILMAAGWVHELHRYRPRLAQTLVIPLLILAVWHLTRTWDPASVWEWRYDAHTHEVIQNIQADQASQNSTSLNLYWWFYWSFEYETRFGKADWLELGSYSKELNREGSADYYYVPKDELEQLKDQYVPLNSYGNEKYFLLKRKSTREE